MSIHLLFSPNICWAKKEKKVEFNLRKLVLPSEVQSIGKNSGSIYYSPTVKGKVLIPVHIWGEISKSGLHFIPIDTTLINGISLAGGPTGSAELENIKLTRKGPNGVFNNQKFDISTGGDRDIHNYKLKPDDTIFIKRSRFNEDRAYYTSLTGVIATILSSVLLFKEVQKSN